MFYSAISELRGGALNGVCEPRGYSVGCAPVTIRIMSERHRRTRGRIAKQPFGFGQDPVFAGSNQQYVLIAHVHDGSRGRSDVHYPRSKIVLNSAFAMVSPRETIRYCC